MKPISTGAVCLFTIKNPSFPDYICITNSGVMCVDIHPIFPYMLVVGLYDGNVMVYNIQASCKEPAYKSNSVHQKHSGLVSEVSTTNSNILKSLIKSNCRSNGFEICQMEN